MTILENELKQAATLPAVKTRLESDSIKLKEERQELRKRSDLVSEGIEKLRIRLISAERMLAKGKELAGIEKGLKENKERLAQTRFDNASFENTRLSLEKLHLDSERLLSEKRSVETQMRTCQEMLSIVRSELSTLLSFEKEIKDLAGLEEQLLVYKNALLETQTHLRTTLTDAINSAMNEIWPIFYPYKNYPALRLAVSEKDYVFEVNDNGGWKALETIASGGERACAALTLRTALAMVLTPKLSWLILDEPTHNLDSNAVELLSSALEQKVPEIVAQTFVITHDETFMGSEFASSYRLLRDKEKNGETRIENI
jgi:DNA repair exonuclease SbcCD ATPase subunit